MRPTHVRAVRALRGVPFFLALLLLAALSHATSQTGDPARSPWSDTLLKIQRLRAEGRYDESSKAARDYHEMLLQRARPSAFHVDEVERLIATLELIEGLPDWAQEELAEADSLFVQSIPLWHAGKYSVGADIHQRRLEILRRHFGEDHMEVAGCLHELAACLSHMGDYAQAEPLFRQTLEMRLDLYGRVHPDVARTLEYLGELYAAEGNENRADSLYKAALHVWAAYEPRPLKIEDSRSDVVRLWARMAKLYIDQGDYAKAMPWLRDGLAAFRGHWRHDNWLTAMLLNHQAIVLWKQGDYVTAVGPFEEALRMRRKDLGAEHPHSIQSLTALGTVLSQCGAPDVAEPLLWDALEQIRSIRKEGHPDITAGLLSLATLMRSKADHVAAESLCCEALANCRYVPDEERLDVARCLHQLATIQMVQGKLGEGEAGFREALRIRRRFLSTGHPDVVQNLHDLARCLLAQGRPAAAEPFLSEAAAAFETARLRVGTGYARATFQSSPYAALAVTRLMLGKAVEAWPAAERAHGRALTDLLAAAKHRSLSPAENVIQDSLQRTVSRLESQLAVLRESARSDTVVQVALDFDATRARLPAAEAAWWAFQREIAAKYPVTEGQAFSLRRVQNVLTDQTALLGWLHVEMGPEDVASWGYVIRNEGPVYWAPLGAAPDVDTAPFPLGETRDFREALAIAASWEERVTEVAGLRSVALHVWAEWLAPLTRYLDGVDDLVVIPAGPMLGVPIEALVDSAGVYLADRYAVSYAPSATVHTWLQENAPEGETPNARTALLLGDPPFTAEHLAAMEWEEETEEVILALTERLPEPAALRSALAGNAAALASLPRLPWTREEVGRVASVFPEARTLLGAEASEQSFVHLAESGALRGFGTIHLATHALVDDEVPKHSAIILSRADLPDPLEAAMADTRVFDGLLTAKEIVREWDLDADLVTLSGCQTGLGREVAGEGYIGLAHAFLQAGARSLLVSLWRVDDEATCLLMGRFYENLTGAYQDVRRGRRGEPMPKAEALREAKGWLRAYRDERGQQLFRHPVYWSGFVLIGDPG